MPLEIVEREIPVARSTNAMPPWPRDIAPDAARRRPDRSVSAGPNAEYFLRMRSISMPANYPYTRSVSVTYLGQNLKGSPT